MISKPSSDRMRKTVYMHLGQCGFIIVHINITLCICIGLQCFQNTFIYFTPVWFPVYVNYLTTANSGMTTIFTSRQAQKFIFRKKLNYLWRTGIWVCLFFVFFLKNIFFLPPLGIYVERSGCPYCL